MEKRIVTFGELLLRLAAPGHTKLFQQNRFDVSFCGGEANVAVSLANFGMNVTFITKLPNTDVGYAASKTLQYFNVDISNIVYQNGRMGLYYLEQGASQRPSKIIYDRSNSVFSSTIKGDFDWNSLFTDTAWFHWTGINPALSDSLIEVCQDACIAAKEKGVLISCDLNYRKSLWSVDKARMVMKKLMPYVDICIANEADVQDVLGIQTENSDYSIGKIDIDKYADMAKTICKEYSCKYVAFTLRESFSASDNGWSGLLYSFKDEQLYVSPKYNIHIVDRVGGGDSFAAGLIYGMMQYDDLQKVIEFATAASCLKQTMEGDFNRSTVEDVLNLVQGNGLGRVVR